MLERLLVVGAAQAGATIVGRAQTATRTLQGWAVQCDHMSNVQASFAIAASGRGACPIHFPAQWLSASAMIACTVMVDTAQVTADRRVLLDAVEEGWLYSVQPPTGPRTISLFTSPEIVRQTGRLFADLVARAVGQAPCISGIVAPASLPAHATLASAGVAMRARVCGDQFTVCGDAAQTLDPLSSEGILAALADGVAAAQFVIQYDAAAAKQREYDHRRRFLEHLRMRVGYYHAESRWPDSPFWNVNGSPRSIIDFVSRHT